MHLLQKLMATARERAASQVEKDLVEELAPSVDKLVDLETTFPERLHALRRSRGIEVKPLSPGLQRKLAEYTDEEAEAQADQQILQLLDGKGTFAAMHQARELIFQMLEFETSVMRTGPRNERHLAAEIVDLRKVIIGRIDAVAGRDAYATWAEGLRSDDESGGALFIVTKSKLLDFDTFVNGKALGGPLESLDAICTDLEVNTLTSYWVIDEEEETWFAPEDGLKTVDALLAFLEKKPRAIKASKAVKADLKEFQEVLRHLVQVNVPFRLALDD